MGKRHAYTIQSQLHTSRTLPKNPTKNGNSSCSIKFFHAWASQRRKNQIKLKNDQGEWCESREEIQNVAIAYFKALFTSARPYNQNIEAVTSKVASNTTRKTGFCIGNLLTQIVYLSTQKVFVSAIILFESVKGMQIIGDAKKYELMQKSISVGK